MADGSGAWDSGDPRLLSLFALVPAGASWRGPVVGALRLPSSECCAGPILSNVVEVCWLDCLLSWEEKILIAFISKKVLLRSAA